MLTWLLAPFTYEFIQRGFIASVIVAMLLYGRWLLWAMQWRMQYCPELLMALTIVASIQTVGVVMVAAMLVTPAAAAFILSKRLPLMMGISCLIGIISSVVGLYISYYANVASGAAIVLTATAIFLIVFLFSPERGVIWSRFRRHTKNI